MPPKITSKPHLRRAAAQLAVQIVPQLPSDPAEARIVLQYVQEIVAWMASSLPDTRPES
jgi:hypothetical protein